VIETINIRRIKPYHNWKRSITNTSTFPIPFFMGENDMQYIASQINKSHFRQLK
jgi:hypothetical protein